MAYVQLVYGRQLQQPEDEQPAAPLDVSRMSREERDQLKRCRPRTPAIAAEARGPGSGRDEPVRLMVLWEQLFESDEATAGV